MCNTRVPMYLMPPDAGLGAVSADSLIGAGSSVLAFASNPFAAVMSGLNPVLSAFGLNSSDPVKDAQRAQRINDTYRLAMQGDPAAVACLRDMAQGVSSGPNDPRACAVGSQVAATYAKKMWNDFQGRVGAGVVGAELIGASNIPSTIVGAAQSLVTSPVFLVLAAGGLFLLLRRRR